MPQISFPAALYRGGTSRGLLFHEKDLPEDAESRTRVFLHGIDAWNLSQIDGVGAGTSHTSKCAVIASSDRPGVHINYHYVQVSIGTPMTNSKGTCGNLMVAAAAFAVDEGLVPLEPGQEEVKVVIFDVNTSKIMHVTVPLVDARTRSSGDCRLPGLVRGGALVRVDILNPGGGRTGKSLPCGPTTTLDTRYGSFEVTIADIVNPFVFVRAADVGLTGAESFAELSVDKERLAILGAIREAAAVTLGWAATPGEAREKTPGVPKIALVGPPRGYTATSGSPVEAGDMDIVGRSFSLDRLHRTFQASGLHCLAGASLLEGTIPAEIVGGARPAREKRLRIGHPDGVVVVGAGLGDDGDVSFVSLERTARRIMKGELYVPLAS